MESGILTRSGQTRATTPMETGWYLTGCVDGSRAMTRVAISSDSFVIGRRQGLSLTLPSPRVSGRHAEILLVGDHLFIRDLSSTNGTFVNRRRIQRPTPLGSGDHIQLADTEFRLEFAPRGVASAHEVDPGLRKTAQALDSFEPDWILSQFDELMLERAVTPYFQPILNVRQQTVIGYEALARSTVAGMQNPAAMFETAALVSREVELSVLCRDRAVEVASQHGSGDTRFFLNTHPREDLEKDVLPSIVRLKKRHPLIQLVVEIHEGAIDDPERVHAFATSVGKLGIEIAYDDFGSGQSRLLELVQAPPNYLKFDACLVRDAHRASPHQWKMLEMLVEMAHGFSTMTLAEGIETSLEAEACRDLGFDMVQGYHFGRPAPLRKFGFSTQFCLSDE
jgi:EAL domain-containing protein (putative c-di-GMP-specific phosphodiesterase class I)